MIDRTARRPVVARVLTIVKSVALLHPQQAGAQTGAGAAPPALGVGLHGVGLIVPKPLLGERLYGAGLDLHIPLGMSRAALRFAVDGARSTSDRIGVPCAGLIQPGTCAPEPVRDRADFVTVSGGVSRRVLGSVRNGLGLTVDAAVALAHVETTGRTSGRKLPASKTFWGGLAGAEAFWTPVRRVPDVVTLGLSGGGLTPSTTNRVVDGYTPFEQGFAIGRMYVGAAWRP